MTHCIGQNGCDPRMAAIHIVVVAIDQLIRRTNIIVRAWIERVDTVRIGSDICRREDSSFVSQRISFTLLDEADAFAILIVEFETIQSNVVRIAMRRMQLKFVND